MKKFLLFMLGVLAALPGIARDFSYEYEGQTLIYTVLDEEAKTCKTKVGISWPMTAGNSVSGELIVPETAKDGDIEYAVKEIGDYAFTYCSGLTSVAIPNTVTTIGEGAFWNCSGLTSVVIPNSVTTIGKSAFNSCDGLTSVNIGTSVKEIGDYAFSYCRGLTSINIPGSVTSIGEDAFRRCAMTSVSIPVSVKEISAEVFYGCTSLTSVDIPHSVTSIGGGAFRDCTSLTSIDIPNSVLSFGNNVFRGCTSLTSVVIPPSVISGGTDIFRDCTGLIKSAFPYGLDMSIPFGTVIKYPREGAVVENGFIYGPEKNAIYFAPLSLEGDFVIPGSVSLIGENAFDKCTGLTSVTLPGAVTSVAKLAFANCTNLKTFTVEAGEDKIDFGANALGGTNVEVLYMGKNWSYELNSTLFPSIKSVSIGNSVTEIPNHAFKGCSALTSVVIPNSVTTIGESAFGSCGGLTSVNIGTAVKEIGKKAFSYCSGLTSVAIPPSVTSIGEEAFYGCTGLKKSAYPSGLSNPFCYKNTYYGFAIEYPREGAIIEENLVYGPEKTSIYFAPYSLEGRYEILSSVTSIRERAFANCPSLTSIDIPVSVKEIGENAFADCIGLTSIDIPLSVKEIGKSAFGNCSGLTSVNIGTSVTSIGDNAFSGCSGLTSVVIPASVTSIGEKAFSACTGLKTFTVDDGEDMLAFGNDVLEKAPVENLYVGRNWSFSQKGCIWTTVKSVEIGNSVTALPFGAFSGCTGLTSLDIPTSVTSIGDNAFARCTGLTTLDIPTSVSSIGGYAFANCTGLTSLNIPTSVTSIGNAAFLNCTGLASLNIPNSITTIGEEVFRGCTGLVSVGIPTSVKEIGDRAFYECVALASLDIPTSVTSIGEKAFYECESLTWVIIPGSVTTVGKEAFGRCSGLIKSAYPSGLPFPFPLQGSYYSGIEIEYPREGAIIEDGFVYGPEKDAIYFAPLSYEGEYVIPTSVTSIGEKAFYGCTGFAAVTLTNVTPPVMNDNSFDGMYDRTVLSVPEDAVSYYLATNWSLFKSLRTGDAEVAYKTYETGNLKYRLIPAPTSGGRNVAVVIPGDYSALTEVTIPERFTVAEDGANVRYFVDAIGFRAFNGCSNLTTVTFNSRNASNAIGDYAFNKCTSLTAIAIPGYVKTVGKRAFAGCSNLQKVEIPAGVETIGDYAFSSCNALTDIVIPGSVRNIGTAAFYLCQSLVSATLESGVGTIGDYAFRECTSLPAIVVPGSVNSIGNAAFYRCSALTSATLESGVGVLDDNAFRECTSLTGIEIPGSVRSIGMRAFCGTTKLSQVTFNEGLESIGAEAFSAYGSRMGQPIYVPSTLMSVGEGAFLNFNCEKVNIPDLTAWCNIEFENTYSNPAAYGQGLYLNDEKIENLVIPESVNEIKNYAFCNNSAIKAVKFNYALQGIGTEAFNGCSGLTSVIVPGNVTAIGDNAFASTNVKDLTFAYGASPVEIGEGAFVAPESLSWDRPVESLNLDVNSLVSLTIGNSLTEIPDGRFKKITTLAALNLGNGLVSVGDEAFSGCTGLTEVILPPSAETIGAAAFAGNTKLTSIVMGHNVRTIGAKAYDLCPAQKVCITAQTPPDAPDNTFSNYTGSLYVQGQKALDAYYEADYCWYQFEGHALIEPTELKIDGDKVLNGKPGDTFRLTAALYPANVTLPQIFWRSTNPDIAVVDPTGLVTVRAGKDDVMAMAEDGDSSANSCKIIAESLYADGPVAEVSVNASSAGVDEITDNSTPGDIDYSAPVEVYNLQGVKVSTTVDNLTAGIYIVRQGNNVKKIAVK